MCKSIDKEPVKSTDQILEDIIEESVTDLIEDIVNFDMNSDEISTNTEYTTSNENNQLQIQLFKVNTIPDYLEEFSKIEKLSYSIYDSRTDIERQRVEDLLENVFQETPQDETLNVINSELALKINPETEARLKEINISLQKLRKKDQANIENKHTICTRPDFNQSLQQLQGRLLRVNAELTTYSNERAEEAAKLFTRSFSILSLESNEQLTQ